MFKTVFFTDNLVSIVMDFCDGGSLLSYLEKNKGRVSHDRMIQIAEDIGKGMVARYCLRFIFEVVFASWSSKQRSNSSRLGGKEHIGELCKRVQID